jgi:hypothetical protein
VAYDEKMLVEPLRENMADDPYGTASYVILEACKAAAQYNGLMSDLEYATICSVARALDQGDPFIKAREAMSKEFRLTAQGQRMKPANKAETR